MVDIIWRHDSVDLFTLNPLTRKPDIEKNSEGLMWDGPNNRIVGEDKCISIISFIVRITADLSCDNHKDHFFVCRVRTPGPSDSTGSSLLRRLRLRGHSLHAISLRLYRDHHHPLCDSLAGVDGAQSLPTSSPLNLLHSFTRLSIE